MNNNWRDVTHRETPINIKSRGPERKRVIQLALFQIASIAVGGVLLVGVIYIATLTVFSL